MGKRAAPVAPAPAGKKITFGSDDEFDEEVTLPTPARPAQISDSDDDSDDDAPEMIGASGAKAAEQRREQEAEE